MAGAGNSRLTEDMFEDGTCGCFLVWYIPHLSRPNVDQFTHFMIAFAIQDIRQLRTLMSHAL